MLDITYGGTKNNAVVSMLVEELKNAPLNGDLFIGYPMLGGIEGRIEVDALLLTAEHGLIAIDLQSPGVSDLDAPSAEAAKKRQDDIFVSLENKLKSYSSLRDRRSLAFDINVVSIVPEISGTSDDGTHVLATAQTLLNVIEDFNPLQPDLHKSLNAALQHTATIRPSKKRADIEHANSRGAKMRRIEASIANMDAWQKKAAIEFPESPQRIRGLAGSGKTVVLAQKAAILHAKNPEWKIAVTFQTRSLYQQFQNLIERFYRELTLDDPDWTKLKILHAWGSAAFSGLYYETAKEIGHSVKDFSYAKSRYGYDRAFEGICTELLNDLKARPSSSLFDAVLIDEAQDFPQPFFEIVYHITPDPHRIVWAYDELQNLGDYTMPPATELFGSREDGKPNVDLKNQEGSPQQDIVLPICYRNTKWALTLAHGLGFGVYRERGLVQFFDAPELWDDIGYRFLKGQPKGGSKVVVERKPNSSPDYFDDLLTAEEAVQIGRFDSAAKQYQWIATQIKKNIEEDELEPDDIMVIFCEPRSIKSESAKLVKVLAGLKIPAHVAGVTASRDRMFNAHSVALTGIYRAKGNEAPVVYVVNAEHCYDGFELSKKRNILFTAMTRSRAWVTITGVGSEMQKLQREASCIMTNEFRLDFKYPSKEEIAKIKRLHRDMPQDEKMAIENDLEGVLRLVQRIEDGDLDPAVLPDSVQKLVERVRR